MSTNREIFQESPLSRISVIAESYADSVHPSCRVASKRAFLDGYLEAMEHEGLYADEVQEMLSSAYSNLKVTHHELKQKIKYYKENREEQYKLYLKLKEEFDGTQSDVRMVCEGEKGRDDT